MGLRQTQYPLDCKDMFKLNRMTDHSIAVLGAFARRQGETLASTQLAELTGPNRPTDAKVAKTRVAPELLDNQRGAHGGYRLSQEAAIISLVQIVEAMEGPIAANDCDDGAVAPGMITNCNLMSQNWSRVNQVVRDALDDVRLEDLISTTVGCTDCSGAGYGPQATVGATE